MDWQFAGFPQASDRARREPSKRSHAIIHHDGPCDSDVDTEFCRYFDNLIATLNQFRAEGSALGP